MVKDDDKPNQQPHGEQTTLQDYIVYISIGGQIYSPKRKDEE